MLHIYTTKKQPATNWTDTHSGEPIQMGWPPEKLIYAQCCGKKRPARNLVVQSYYDCTMVWCAEGHGCKHPQAIAAKKWREHMNRSRAQQARRAREKAPNDLGNRRDAGPIGGASVLTDELGHGDKP